MKICSVEGCGIKHKSKGYCRKHYESISRNYVRPTVDERFASKIQSNELTGCNEWIGSKNEYGYGVININKKPVKAHRLAYKKVFGEIPKGMFICHKCDNPSCVNVDHLFLGTPSDNHQDMTKKNRQVIPVGEHNGKSKLNEIDVMAIKIQLRWKIDGASISRQFNVNKSTIYQIRDGDQDLLFEAETAAIVDNMYLEVVASILSSVNITVINGFAKDVSDNSDDYKTALVEISKSVIREIIYQTEQFIKQTGMH